MRKDQSVEDVIDDADGLINRDGGSVWNLRSYVKERLQAAPRDKVFHEERQRVALILVTA